MDWCTYGSLTVKYFHRFLPPCCANKIPADGKDFRLLMAAADLWFPELDGYEVSVAIFKINIPGRSALFWEECTNPWSNHDLYTQENSKRRSALLRLRWILFGTAFRSID